uniref:NTR domain-containing protein n=1 Tax=Magallana gigas TaxID=29159 RepID=A0A8W8JKE9_MAGGI
MPKTCHSGKCASGEAGVSKLVNSAHFSDCACQAALRLAVITIVCVTCVTVLSVTWIQKYQECGISTLCATRGASNGSALMELYVLELSYTTGGLYEACFKIQTENVKIKVSQESWKNTKSHFAGSLPQSSLLKPLFSVNGRTSEHCMYSNTPVLLYLEPERTHDMSGFPRMKLEYVLERKTPQHLQNSLEDCRPCDTEELIRSYCTSDFVFIGEMGRVRNRDEDEKSEVEFKVTRVVRKLGALHFRTNTDIQQQYGKIVVPKKCQVRNGRGIFLITGSVRFGELAKTCSPYLSDWENIANIALREGRMECPLVL